MAFCLNKNLVNKFLEKMKSGEINPQKLAEMSSEERRSFFAEFLGEENAKKTNTLFESKLLLKNQQQGIINWAKQVTGLKPEVRNDIIARVNRMTEVLNPKEEQAFLEDLAAHKMGIAVTFEEAAHISELAKDAAEKKDAVQNGGDRIEYGKARVKFLNYVDGLKEDAGKISVSERLQPKNIGRNIKDFGGLTKSLKASLDNSALFMQGFKSMWTHPTIWLKNAQQSFVNLVKTFGGKAVMDEVRADIMSRPNYDLMKKAKLGIGNLEESFPTTLPEKIPLFGKVYKASETAFTSFVQKQRADIFDKYIEVAKKTGVDLSDPNQLTSIGKLVNSLTGRGSLGRLEGSKGVDALNNVFFSPRALKSHIDTLLLHATDINFSKFARKQAAINLIKIVSGTSIILAVANAIAPGSVEKDPRSSDFGKIKIGDTRFNVSGGMASVVTLASRLLSSSTKSNSGIVSKLNSGDFGSQSRWDVLLSFMENKFSPLAGATKDILKGRDFEGNKPTIGGELKNLLLPLPIANYMELRDDPKSANTLLAMIADAVGIGTNTYSSDADWSHNTGSELAQFKQKVGDKNFNEANDKYNQKYNDWMESMKKNQKFQDLSDEEKQRVMTNKKAEIKKIIFNHFGFKYQSPKKKPLPKF